MRPIQFIQQPYPIGGRLLQKLRQNLFIGAFVAFFLIVFQPFGTAEWHSPVKLWCLLGYGLVSFIAPSMLHALVFGIYGEEKLEKNWTVGKELAINMLILFCIALGNMLYSNGLGITQITLSSLFSWMIIVVLVGVFPLTASVLIRYGNYIALNRRDAAVMENNLHHFQAEGAIQHNPQPAPLVFRADNEKDELTINAADLLFVESADNYANFIFLKNEVIQKRMLRGTLKRFDDQIGENPLIIRCHRSFIVNLAQVEHALGNAQGYRLTLRYDGLEVPVARNYGPVVLERLRALAP